MALSHDAEWSASGWECLTHTQHSLPGSARPRRSGHPDPTGHAGSEAHREPCIPPRPSLDRDGTKNRGASTGPSASASGPTPPITRSQRSHLPPTSLYPLCRRPSAGFLRDASRSRTDHTPPGSRPARHAHAGTLSGKDADHSRAHARRALSERRYASPTLP